MPISINPGAYRLNISNDLGDIGTNLRAGMDRRNLTNALEGWNGDYNDLYKRLIGAGFPGMAINAMNNMPQPKSPKWQYNSDTGNYYDENAPSPPSAPSPADPAVVGMNPRQKKIYLDNIAKGTAERDLEAPVKNMARESLSGTLEPMLRSYLKLHELGGSMDPKLGIMPNISAWAGNTDIGQSIQGAIGTQQQSERQKIAALRPGLMQSIKTASGMSAQQMNSNFELQMQIKQATDPSFGIEANLLAIDRLDRQYGLGGVLDKVLSDRPDLLERARVKDGGSINQGEKDQYGFSAGETREVPGKGTAIYRGNNQWELQ